MLLLELLVLTQAKLERQKSFTMKHSRAQARMSLAVVHLSLQRNLSKTKKSTQIKIFLGCRITKDKRDNEERRENFLKRSEPRTNRTDKNEKAWGKSTDFRAKVLKSMMNTRRTCSFSRTLTESRFYLTLNSMTSRLVPIWLEKTIFSSQGREL